MKSIYKLFFFSILLFSCEENEVEYIYTINGVNIEAPVTPIMIEENHNIKLSLNNKSKLEYQLSYEVLNLKSENISLEFDNKNYSQNKTITHKNTKEDDVINLKFSSKEAGNYKIILYVDNGYEAVSSEIVLQFRDISYSIDHEIETIQANTPTSFTINIDPIIIGGEEKGTSSEDETYLTTALFLKNKGYVKLATEGNKVKNTEENKFNLKSGLNKLMIYTEEVGETSVDFDLETTRGVIKYNVLFNTETPNKSTLTVEVKQTTTDVEIGNSYSFTADVKNNSPKDKFNISYRWINGNESVSINSNDLEMGEQVETSSGIQTFIIKNLNPIGERELEVVFTDQYGQKITETINFNIVSNGFSLEIDQITEQKENNKPFNHSFIVNGSNTDKYEILLSSIKGSSAIKVNGKTAVNGVKTEVNRGSNVLEITPSTIGENIINLIVSDPYGQEVSKKLSFTSKAIITPLNFSITGITSEEIFIDSNTSFNAIINEEGYSGEFKGTYRFLNGTGELIYKGSPISAGTEFVATSGQSVFGFTPTSIGNIEIEITIQDENDQAIIQTVSFNVIRNEILINSSSVLPIEIDQVSVFTIKVSQKNYNDNFTVTYALEGGGGILNFGDEIWEQNTNKIFNNETTHSLTFTPKIHEVNNTLIFTIKDKYNNIIDHHITIDNIKTPIVLISSSNNINTYNNTEKEFTLTATKNKYQDNISTKYEIISGTGKFMVDGKLISNLGSFILTNKIPKTVSFLPTSIGATKIKFTSSTKNQSVINEINFIVAEIPNIDISITDKDKVILNSMFYTYIHT